MSGSFYCNQSNQPMNACKQSLTEYVEAPARPIKLPNKPFVGTARDLEEIIQPYKANTFHLYMFQRKEPESGERVEIIKLWTRLFPNSSHLIFHIKTLWNNYLFKRSCLFYHHIPVAINHTLGTVWIYSNAFGQCSKNISEVYWSGHPWTRFLLWIQRWHSSSQLNTSIRQIL